MGWIIIGILLLIFFSGSGTLFCFVFLNEAGSIEAWCATGVCVVLTCIVVCYLRVKELWKASYILSIIGVFGIIQLIILGMVETPYFWQEDGTSIRFFAAFWVQPVICLVSYFISSYPIDIYDEKLNTTLSGIKNKLNLQIKALNDIKCKVVQISDKQKVADEVVMLLEKISDCTISSKYNQMKVENHRELFNELCVLNEKYNLDLYWENKTMLEISMQLKEISNDRDRQLRDINKNVYTRQNLKELRQMLQKMK